MKNVDMTLRDVYRSNEVKRWHMVQTRKQQSVAEHSFLVAMIAMRACEIMQIGGNGILAKVTSACLLHDLPEVYAGDIATPSKNMLIGEAARGNIDRFESSIYFTGKPVHVDDVGFIGDIVKLADTVEAIAFLDNYGEGPYALDAMARLIERAHEKWGSVAEQLIYELTQGPIQTMGSIFNEA